MKALFVCFVALAYSTQAQEVWTPLYNGKNLSGWHSLNGKAKFEAKGDEIVGTTVADTGNSFLATDQSYGDFILELEFKVDQKSNSGIQIRSASSSDYRNGRVHGYQVEIDPSARAWTGGLYEEGGREWLYPLEYNTGAKTAFRQGDWNKFRIECIGTVIRSWINGIPASNLVDNAALKGFIALQVHSVNNPQEAGQQIHWKNIRIQTAQLHPSPADSIFVMNLTPNALSEQEKANGLSLLWDGTSTAGWRRAHQDKFPEKGWEIKDGTLSTLPSDGGEATNGGDIVTMLEYGAFDLQFEFKLTEGANSGVKYFVTEKDVSAGSAIGLEYQILDDARHPDAKLGAGGNRTLASLYDLIASKKNDRGIHPIGEWNQGRIVVYPDNRVEHWLNGYKVVEYLRGSDEYKALVAKSKYVHYENFGMAPTGHILLQDHGSRVYFRSVKIKDLK